MPIEQIANRPTNVKDLVTILVRTQDSPLFAFDLAPSAETRKKMLDGYETLRDANYFQVYSLINLDYHVAMKYLFPEMHFEQDEKAITKIRHTISEYSYEDPIEKLTHATLFNPVTLRNMDPSSTSSLASLNKKFREFKKEFDKYKSNDVSSWGGSLASWYVQLMILEGKRVDRENAWDEIGGNYICKNYYLEERSHISHFEKFFSLKLLNPKRFNQSGIMQDDHFRRCWETGLQNAVKWSEKSLDYNDRLRSLSSIPVFYFYLAAMGADDIQIAKDKLEFINSGVPSEPTPMPKVREF